MLPLSFVTMSDGSRTLQKGQENNDKRDQTVTTVRSGRDRFRDERVPHVPSVIVRLLSLEEKERST